MSTARESSCKFTQSLEQVKLSEEDDPKLCEKIFKKTLNTFLKFYSYTARISTPWPSEQQYYSNSYLDCTIKAFPIFGVL